ncbi:serine hydrolase domain-containing protein [Acidobacteriota bacterium]
MKKQKRKKTHSGFISAGILAFLLIVTFTFSVGADQLSDRIDKIFAKWDKNDSPGCALAVYRDGKIIYKRGYGMADLERDVPLSSKSVFDIGSTSKQFVAMCILLLEEDGKLSLDDDIRKYISKIPGYGDTITIRHLIHHTSGIRDYLGLMAMAGMNFANDFPEEEIIDLIARQKALNFKPGDEHLYSNSGYFLLAEIVKRASGKSLGEFAKENIFIPLQMNNTQFYDDYSRIVKNRAIGYMPEDSGGFRTELYLFDLVGDGGVLTSVEDLFLWDQNFYRNKLGKSGQDLIKKMQTKGKLNNGKDLTYAFALGIGAYRGLKTVSHGGSWAGYRAQLIRFPEQKFSVACLTNLGTNNPSKLCKQVADIYLAENFGQDGKPGKSNVKPAVKPQFIKLSKSRLQKSTGAFRNPETGSNWELSVKENRLQAELSSGYTFHFSPVSKNEFHALDAPVEIKITFVKSGKSGTKNLRVEIEAREAVIYEPFRVFSATPEQLRDYAGDYYSEELDVTYKIGVKTDTLFAAIKYDPEAIHFKPVLKDEFTVGGMLLNFKRNEVGAVTGFCVNSGRVKNICFSKKRGN